MSIFNIILKCLLPISVFNNWPYIFLYERNKNNKYICPRYKQNEFMSMDYGEYCSAKFSVKKTHTCNRNTITSRT